MCLKTIAEKSGSQKTMVRTERGTIHLRSGGGGGDSGETEKKKGEWGERGGGGQRGGTEK